MHSAVTIMKTQQVLLAAAVLLVAAAAPFAEAWAEGSWVTARATYYGRDAWSVDTGACGFGFICPDRCGSRLLGQFCVVMCARPMRLPYCQRLCLAASL